MDGDGILDLSMMLLLGWAVVDVVAVWWFLAAGGVGGGVGFVLFLFFCFVFVGCCGVLRIGVDLVLGWLRGDGGRQHGGVVLDLDRVSSVEMMSGGTAMWVWIPCDKCSRWKGASGSSGWGLDARRLAASSEAFLGSATYGWFTAVCATVATLHFHILIDLGWAFRGWDFC